MGYCKYCDRVKNNIIRKQETHIVDGVTHTYYWIGCRDCWERLQKIA